jgi:branched-chain amino acid transport system permease protein
MAFFLEALLGGLMAGMLYSLVALGFVLILQGLGCVQFCPRRDGVVCGLGHGALCRVDCLGWTGFDRNHCWPT